MPKQFAVLGLGKFGCALAETLYTIGHEVLAVDKDIAVVEDIADRVTQAVQADMQDEAALRQLGLRNYDSVIISATDNLQVGILACMTLSEMGVEHIICTAQNALHARVLSRVGANHVILPERDMGVRMAHKLTSPKILDIIEFTPGYSIAEINAHDAWHGKTLTDLDLRKRFGVTIIAIRHQDGSIQIAPHGDAAIAAQDVLIMLGSDEGILLLEDAKK